MALLPRHLFLPVEVIAVVKLSTLFKKYRSIILYAIFGLLTTVVNYFVYFPLYYWAEFTAVFSNVIAWLFAVIFAYITNKIYVFNTNNWSFRAVIKESFAFFSCRVLTGALETVALFIAVDYLGMNSIVWKLAISFGIVFINYISSKLFVFRK